MKYITNLYLVLECDSFSSFIVSAKAQLLNAILKKKKKRSQPFLQYCIGKIKIIDFSFEKITNAISRKNTTMLLLNIGVFNAKKNIRNQYVLFTALRNKGFFLHFNYQRSF